MSSRIKDAIERLSKIVQCDLGADEVSGLDDGSGRIGALLCAIADGRRGGIFPPTAGSAAPPQVVGIIYARARDVYGAKKSLPGLRQLVRAIYPEDAQKKITQLSRRQAMRLLIELDIEKERISSAPQG